MKKLRGCICICLCLALITVTTVIVNGYSGMSETQEKVAEILGKVLRSKEEGVLINYTMDDLTYVLDNDLEAGEKIIAYLDSISVPASPSDRDIDTRALPADEHFSAEYDPETGEEKFIYEDELYLDPISDSTEKVDENITKGSAFSVPSDFPHPDVRSDYYFEDNPQDYDETKFVFKLFIMVSGSDQVFNGTGFKVGGMYLATAGHCVYDGNYGGWAGDILCIPAWRTGYPQSPLGSSYNVGSNMTCGGNWRVYGDFDDDWGIINLKSSVHTGYLGKNNVGDDDSINGWGVRVMGYPYKSYPLLVSKGIVQDTGRRRVSTDYTCFNGMSGGPVIEDRDLVIGIHTRGGSEGGEFVKFDNWIFNKMCSYM